MEQFNFKELFWLVGSLFLEIFEQKFDELTDGYNLSRDGPEA